MKEQLDFPLNQIVEEANKLLLNPNVNVYQKFTCEQCENRLTIEDANVFYTSGTCDKCGHVTNIQDRGCNFLVIMGGIPK